VLVVQNIFDLDKIVFNNHSYI